MRKSVREMQNTHNFALNCMMKPHDSSSGSRFSIARHRIPFSLLHIYRSILWCLTSAKPNQTHFSKHIFRDLLSLDDRAVVLPAGMGCSRLQSLWGHRWRKHGAAGPCPGAGLRWVGNKLPASSRSEPVTLQRWLSGDIRAVRHEVLQFSSLKASTHTQHWHSAWPESTGLT